MRSYSERRHQVQVVSLRGIVSADPLVRLGVLQFPQPTTSPPPPSTTHPLSCASGVTDASSASRDTAMVFVAVAGNKNSIMMND